MKGCDELLGLQDTLKALADPIRREILNLLKGGRLSAGEICEHFSVTGASISRHLAILKDADLNQEQKGRKIYLLRTKYFCIGGCYVVDHRLKGGIGL